jgi:hypothetical protein
MRSKRNEANRRFEVRTTARATIAAVAINHMEVRDTEALHEAPKRAIDSFQSAVVIAKGTNRGMGTPRVILNAVGDSISTATAKWIWLFPASEAIRNSRLSA